MCDGRLSDIAVLSIESKRSQAIDFDAVVDEFDARHQNRKLACIEYGQRGCHSKIIGWAKCASRRSPL